MARDTKLGPKKSPATSQLSEQQLNRLDESASSMGAEVQPGDTLVGKVTRQRDEHADAGRKLLRAIFGEKASDVKDTSLRVDQGSQGTVIDVRSSPAKASSATVVPADHRRRTQALPPGFERPAAYRRGRCLRPYRKVAGGQGRQRWPAKAGQRAPNSTKAYLASVDKFHWFDIRPAGTRVATQLESIKNALEDPSQLRPWPLKKAQKLDPRR